jgi:hypothetical protein
VEGRGDSVLSALVRGGIIDVGEVHISRTSLGRGKPEKRYLVYLPLSRNYLWKALYERGRKVRVYIEVVE